MNKSAYITSWKLWTVRKRLNWPLMPTVGTFWTKELN